VDGERAYPTMFTNGLLLTEENATRLRDAGLHALMVSVDDPRPEVHDQLRGLPGGFKQAVAGMERALDAGLLVALSTYATPEDVREGRVAELIELAREIGAHEVTVFDVVPTGRLLPLDEKRLMTAEDKQQLIALGRHYSALADYPNIITQSEVEGPEMAGCMGASGQFYMTAFGDVDPCDFMPLTFGNIRDESLEAIWMRMRAHPAFAEHCDHCLMQDAEFRRKYIDHIPDDRLLPWPACDELCDRPNTPPAIQIDTSQASLPDKMQQA
jgi:MoaA/NifB/PqqE/SkfB family radical SAM enzyme